MVSGNMEGVEIEIQEEKEESLEHAFVESYDVKQVYVCMVSLKDGRAVEEEVEKVKVNGERYRE